MATNSSLYGIPRPKSGAKEVSSSTSLAFTSQLSSLLSATQHGSRTSSGRARPAHSKSDIFTVHNRNTKKRAAKDQEDDGSRRYDDHRVDIGGVDEALLHRSKRKMEEKARLYAAMKRGDYVAPAGETTTQTEENALVDFDRKWAENEARGEGNELETSSDEDGADSDDETIEYTDEFGRQRRGTAAEAAKEERRKKALEADEPDRFSARPSQPATLIFGDTIQAAAFDPDEPRAAKIEELVRKRDRSLTPPDETHYDATAEVRSKGVGFYSFSKDRQGRKQEMDELERERLETARNRRDLVERQEQRRAALEERRQKIRQARGEKQADRFLADLAGDLQEEPGRISSATRSFVGD